MTRMSGKNDGDLISFKVKHHPSGSLISTNAPKDNGGRGDAFSPTDLLVAAFGSCMATIVSLHASRNNIPLEAVSFELDKIMSSSVPRKIQEIAGWLRIKTSCNEQDFESLVIAAKNCPVALSIHPGITLNIQFSRA